MNRLGMNRSQTSALCRSCENEREDLEHALFLCPSTAEAGLCTLGWAQAVVPGLTTHQALTLDLGDCQLGREEELALVTILGTGLSFIWEARTKKKRVNRYEIRSELEAIVSTLRRSRYECVGDMILHILANN